MCVLATLRRTVETLLTIARDAREARFRRRLERQALASLPAVRPLSEAERAAGLRFLRQFSPRYRNLDWHTTLASVTGRFEAGYVPEDLFYVAIEPALNARDREIQVTDKNGYDRLGLPLPLPETVGRIVRGHLVGPDFRSITMDELVSSAGRDGATEVVLKPTLGVGGGKDVQFVAPQNLPRTLAPLFARRGVWDDWIIQRVFRQCEAMAALNPDSVNTLRIITYRMQSGVVRHLSSVLRIGRGGSRVDNQTSGGLTCGVDEGVLRPVAHLMYQPFEAHPDWGVRFAGVRVPAWREAVDLCISAHELIPAMDLMSWDVAIDTEERPVLIEFNTDQQALLMHQKENGPLPADVVAEWARRASFWIVGGLVIRKPGSS
jgi:hypothetical protein